MHLHTLYTVTGETLLLADHDGNAAPLTVGGASALVTFILCSLLCCFLGCGECSCDVHFVFSALCARRSHHLFVTLHTTLQQLFVKLLGSGRHVDETGIHALRCDGDARVAVVLEQCEAEGWLQFVVQRLLCYFCWFFVVVAVRSATLH
jgi:hypothetical protein